jgi:hypothetical protein
MHQIFSKVPAAKVTEIYVLNPTTDEVVSTYKPHKSQHSIITDLEAANLHGRFLFQAISAHGEVLQQFPFLVGADSSRTQADFANPFAEPAYDEHEEDPGDEVPDREDSAAALEAQAELERVRAEADRKAREQEHRFEMERLKAERSYELEDDNRRRETDGERMNTDLLTALVQGMNARSSAGSSDIAEMLARSESTKNAEIARLKEAHESTLRQVTDSLNRQLDDLRSQKSDLHAQMSRERDDARRERAEAVEAAVDREKDRSEAAIDRLESRYQSEISTLKATAAAEKTAALASLRAEMDAKLRAAENSLTIYQMGAEPRTKALEQQIADLKTMLEAANKELRDARSELSSAQDSVRSLQMDLRIQEVETAAQVHLDADERRLKLTERMVEKGILKGDDLGALARAQAGIPDPEPPAKPSILDQVGEQLSRAIGSAAESGLTGGAEAEGSETTTVTPSAPSFKQLA